MLLTKYDPFKELRDFEALKVIINSINYEGRDENLDYTLDHKIVISGAREIEIMDAQRTSGGKFIG